MTPEREQQIDDLFHSALERDAAERPAFIKEACDGDEELCQEIESLLVAHAAAGDLLADSVATAAVALLANQHSGLMTGESIGPYKIIKLLGAGGMGEVYLAEDARLGRQIALKLLPAGLGTENERVRRFEQEARAVSALNHPNILTIHEVGQTASAHFIVTEFVDGVTLRQRLAKGPMTIAEALDVAVEVASAITAAHEAGVVHRDLKPENIMLRRDGYVKLLDFGIAKLTKRFDEKQVLAGTDIGTKQTGTEPGLVMGTVPYMSPEQVRGSNVDGRTDIWSLGVVLFEMVCGIAPFKGGTPGDTIALILRTELPPFDGQGRKAPLTLQRIIQRAVCKESNARYLSSSELLTDLENCRQELQRAPNQGRSASPAGENLAFAHADGETHSSVTSDDATTKGFPARDTAQVSSLEYVVQGLKRHRRLSLSVAIILLLALSGLSFAVLRIVRRTNAISATTFREMKIKRLTSTGRATNAAISPDGKYVVHVMIGADGQSLWLMHLETGSNVEIIPPADVQYLGLTFSPEGNYIYYSVFDKKNAASPLYRSPLLGGAATKVLERVNSPISFAPDRHSFAFVRFYPERNQAAVLTSTVDGGGERQLLARAVPNQIQNLAWSPDGRTIAFGARSFTGGQHFELYTVQLADGRESSLSAQSWQSMGQMAWLADGRGLIMIAQDATSAASQVWQISYPSGVASRITNDLDGYRDLSLTADSRTLVTVQSERYANLWSAPIDDVTQAVQVTSGVNTFDGTNGIAWTPDGKITYRSRAGGVDDIWIADPSHNRQTQLTRGARGSEGLAVSPDGRYIFFAADRSGHSNIWRMNIDGSDQRQLTNGGIEFLPVCTPDGKWVIYTTLAEKPTLFRVSIDGGESKQMSEIWARSQAISPDGKIVAFGGWSELGPSHIALAVSSVESASEVRTFDIPLTFRLDTINWSADGRDLIYIATRNGISNLWRQPLIGGQPVQLTYFKSDQIFNFNLSPDGKQLAFSRGMLVSDVVLIGL